MWGRDVPAGPVLAVSPHLDDAALSAGAALARLDGDATVLTVFAGDPGPELSTVARRHHKAFGLGRDAVAVRRAEDLCAMAALGVRAEHGDLPDAIYRRLPDGRWVCAADGAMVGEPPEDDGLDTRLLTMIGEAARSAGARVMLGPAGVGGHVDHLICRRAVVNAAADLRIPALLWRDEPYGSWRPESRRRGSPDELHLAYSPPFLERKLEAIGCYASQLAMMWPDAHGWREAVAGFGGGRRPPGETFWYVGRG